MLLTTKAYQIPGTARWLARCCGPRTVTVVVQNGVDHADRMAPFALPGPVLPALAYISARRDAPDRVVHAFGERLVVPLGQTGAWFAALLAGSPVTVEQSADFYTAAWRKLLVNVAANPVTALTGRPLGVLGEPGIPPLVHGLLSEAVVTGRYEVAEQVCSNRSERGVIVSPWTSSGPAAWSTLCATAASTRTC